ncbi:MAG: hypothetical protein HGB31_01995 [Erysipelotrichaceae bacterium]|nr:hypothetical protein [Erysipelotrichaceae bacterium]
MKTWIKKNGILTLLMIALIASSFYSYTTYKPLPESIYDEVTLQVDPDYQIKTTKASILWPENTILDQGNKAYFYAVEPMVHYTPSLTLIGANSAGLNGTAQITLTIQAVNDKQEVYWTTVYLQNPSENFQITAGNQSIDLGSVDIKISEITAIIDSISSELNFTNAIFQLIVNVQVQYTGKVNNVSLNNTLNSPLVLSFDGVGFNVPKTSDSITKISLSVNPVGTSYNLVQEIQTTPLPFGLVSLSVLSLLIIVYLRNRSVSENKRQHRKYKEWITDGSVSTKDHININVNTLEGLVDLAIDLDKRVIYDADKEKYHVLEETLIYTFDPQRKKNRSKGEKKLLGKILLESNAILPEQLEVGLLYQQKFDRQLGISLMELGFIDETTLYSTLAAQANIRFLHLDSSSLMIDEELLKKFTLNRARALEALPLGLKKDGKLVVVCANPSRKGIAEACAEVYKVEVELVVTLPSTIYQTIEHLSKVEKERLNPQKEASLSQQNLNKDEQDAFLKNYVLGNIDLELLLKGCGLVGDQILDNVPDKDLLMQSLVNNHFISSQTAHILNGIKAAVLKMNRSDLEMLDCPKLEDVLIKSNYLTQKDFDWARRESIREGVGIEKILLSNYLVSQDSLNDVKSLLDKLSLLLKSE